MHMCVFYHADLCIINNRLVVQVEADNSHRKASQAVLC